MNHVLLYGVIKLNHIHSVYLRIKLRLGCKRLKTYLQTVQTVRTVLLGIIFSLFSDGYIIAMLNAVQTLSNKELRELRQSLSHCCSCLTSPWCPLSAVSPVPIVLP